MVSNVYIELKCLGFRHSLRELCLLYKITSEETILVLVYVDDVLIATTSPVVMDRVVQALEQRFRVKRLGFPRIYVGFEIENCKRTGTLVLHQKMYTKAFLDAFLPQNERGSRKIHMNTFGNFPAGKNLSDKLSPSLPYRSIIGTLYYYANATRPDIIFVVNYLSRVQAKPLVIHWVLLQNLLRYIHGTSEVGIRFTSPGEGLVAYVEPDFGSTSQSHQVLQNSNRKHSTSLRPRIHVSGISATDINQRQDV